MEEPPPHSRSTIHLSCSQWLNFPLHSVSLTLASLNFLNCASLQTPGHFRSLPHSTNMFFGALPRILWHTPMPTPNLLPRLTQIQRTARGSEGGGGYNRVVTVQSWCNGLSKKKKRKKKERREGEGERDLPPALFLCNTALMFGHGLFSVEKLLKASPCLKISSLGLFDGNCDSD